MKEGLMESSFDFSVRLLELVKYLNDEGREFPIAKRLLICGNGIGIHLCIADASSEAEEQTANLDRALACAIESEYVLELMVKTGYLTEKQSKPILKDCLHLKEQIAEAKRK